MTQDFAEQFIEESEAHNQPYIVAFPVSGGGWRVRYWLDEQEHGAARLSESDALEMLKTAMSND